MNIKEALGEYILQTHNTNFLKIQCGGLNPPPYLLWVCQSWFIGELVLWWISGQGVDGPSNGAAPLPWDIRCNPTKMFHTEIRYLEVPHTATIAVRLCVNDREPHILQMQRICLSCSSAGF